MALPSNSKWASLPGNLLHSILDHLLPMEDYPKFSEVCPLWEKTVSEKLEESRSNHKLHCRLHQALPLLLAPTTMDLPQRFSFYDVMEETSVLDYDSGPGRSHCEGSSHGWLILVNCYNVSLYNPLSERIMHLPPLETSISKYGSMISWRRGSVGETDVFRPPPRRGVLSDDPKNGDFVLMMRHTSYVHNTNTNYHHNDGIKHMIVFIRSGDEDWTYQELHGVEDIVYSNGFFYLLDRTGMLFSCEVKRDGYKLRQIPSHSLENPNGVWESSYLVESPGGDLLRVIQKHNGFRVYKLVWIDSRNSIWEEVTDLGDVALFLGKNHSISVTASDFLGCKSNAIYYSQHSTCFCQPVFGSKEGSAYIFSLSDKKIVKSLYPLCHPKCGQPLLWISPNIV